jgi:hypothetical protein
MRKAKRKRIRTRNRNKKQLIFVQEASAPIFSENIKTPYKHQIKLTKHQVAGILIVVHAAIRTLERKISSTGASTLSKFEQTLLIEKQQRLIELFNEVYSQTEGCNE